MPIINGSEIKGSIEKLKLPAGVYDVIVDGVPAIDTSKNSGAQMLVVSLQVVNNPEHAGKKLTEYVNLTGKPEHETLRRAGMERLLTAFGFDLSGQVNTDDLAGRAAKVLVVEESYTKDGVTKLSSKIKEFIKA